MKIPDIRKRPWKNIDLMIIGILEVIDGYAKFLSLGFWCPSRTMDYLEWRTRKMFERMK